MNTTTATTEEEPFPILGPFCNQSPACFPGVKLLLIAALLSWLRQLVAQIADYLHLNITLVYYSIFIVWKQTIWKINFIMDEYSAFEDRVKKTVCVGDLSPLATECVLKAALGQFGDVVKVEFIPNYLHPELPRAALVEMSKPSEAQEIISDLEKTPFMISGMPRPVKVVAAEPKMFDNRPKMMSGKNITLCWLKEDDPTFEEAKKIKSLVRRQEAEANFLIKRQLVEEEKLACKQSVTLKANYKKFELVDGVYNTAQRLGQKYKMNLKDAA